MLMRQKKRLIRHNNIALRIWYLFLVMLASTSVGSTTAVCSLADQVKKYKPRVIHEAAEINSGKKKNGGKQRPVKALDTLVTMCIKVITGRFRSTKENPMHGIPAKFLPDVIQRLPLDLHVAATAPYINDENFWKRSCLARPGWTNLQIVLHGLTWKQLYLGTSWLWFSLSTRS